MMEVRGKLLPYVFLRDFYSYTGEKPPLEQVVVVETSDGLAGMVVDEVIGGYQTVIKNLGTLYKGVEGVSGATILGDGSVALILDVQKIAQQAGYDHNRKR